jgi:hypothetical protein
MRIAAIFVGLGFIVMVAALAYGFVQGEGWDEVGQLMRYPWFVVSLVDVYVGFGLFCGWVAYRERAIAAAVWIVMILTLGNAIACVYVLTAMIRSGGSAPRFWLGRRAAA